jgi:hypothetical protein
MLEMQTGGAAADNPSALVIVASSFTYRNSVKWEMEELGLDLPNVVDGHELLMGDEPVPEWFKNDRRKLEANGFGNCIQEKPRMLKAGWLKTTGGVAGPVAMYFPISEQTGA